jgi:hypothetical protein
MLRMKVKVRSKDASLYTLFQLSFSCWIKHLTAADDKVGLAAHWGPGLNPPGYGPGFGQSTA